MISKRLVVGFSVVFLSVVANADAQSSTRNGAGDSVSFVNDVAPIINAKCGSCHVRSAKGRYSIKSYDALINSDSIEPNQPGSSYFIEVIENGEMPKGGLKVSDKELATLRKWIEEGAKFDGADEDETRLISSMSGGSARGSRDGSTRGSRNSAAGRSNAAGGRASGGRRANGRRGRGSRASAFDSNALLQFLDRDGNGELSLAEIDAAKRLLYSLDVNQDDRLTADEVKDLSNK
jgi:mono/diheme cytochrome c family protein